MKKVLFLAGLIFALASLPASAECVVASHYGYGDGLHGKPTATGERHNAYGMTAAHKTLPFGTILTVTNPLNGLSVQVRINDRGPFIRGRGLDLSYGAAKAIRLGGVGKVCF